MTHPDDITAYLKAKLEDRNPKCANCKWWRNEELTEVAVARCGNNSVVLKYVGVVGVAYTTDLSVCSAWEKRET